MTHPTDSPPSSAGASTRPRAPTSVDPDAPRSTDKADALGKLARWARAPFAVALAIYMVVELVYVLTAGSEILARHTPFNHFALMADAWLHGRLDLGGPPPAYTGNNDFAYFRDHVYVSFPPVPAALITPLVALSGGADGTRDGLFFLLLAGVAPAFVFLALDKLSRVGRSRRSRVENVGLALLFALGTVFWFTSLQGSVWYAGHVVGAGLLAMYLFASIEGDHPLLAGVSLGLAVGTRTPMFLAFPLFVCEHVRASRVGPITDPFFGLAPRRFLRGWLMFLAPLTVIGIALAWHNHARFRDPFEFGHRFLDIYWQARIKKWGLFSTHYLSKNLAIMLTSLPFFGGPNTPIRVNVHGLALTVTSPFYLWALWPRLSLRASTRFSFRTIAIVAALIATADLLYQNSGWIQFGYRFSNDFAPLLFALIALGGRRLRAPFIVAAVFAIAVNAFGALTFQRAGYEKYYFVDRTQQVVFEPD